MAEPAHDDERRPIERRLESLPVGVVAQGLRHAAARIGDHAVGSHDGMTLEADAGREALGDWGHEAACW